MKNTNFNLIENDANDLILLQAEQVKHALQFEKEKTALKFYMTGKGYYQGLKALGFLEQVELKIPSEKRFRKDGKTPSLHHQIRIALSVTLLKGLSNEIEEQCLVNALLHDIQEDHSVSREEIKEKFGTITAEINWKLTKKFAGLHKNKEEYIRDIAFDIVASLVKGLDRADNLNYMIDVFSIDKMESYADEAEFVFLPMVKTASKLFPEVFQAYQTISLQMKRSIQFTKKYVELARLMDVK